MAAIDVAGYVADLKDHSVDHGFHVHDERHFVETYSLRQVWEVDLHPEDGCGGPLDLHLALDVDPRILLSFEDAVLGLPEDDEPPDEYHFPIYVHLGAAAAPPRAGPAAPRDRPRAGGRHRAPARGLRDRLVRLGDGRLGAARHDRRPASGVARRGAGGRGVAVRRLRPVPRCEPPPTRRRARVARGLKGRSIRALSLPAPSRRGRSLPRDCGSGRAALAKQACGYVNSLDLPLPVELHREDRRSDATRCSIRPTTSSRSALQPAAIAARDDAKWQALMATISESSRVPESVLVSALQQQCAVADGQSAPPNPGQYADNREDRSLGAAT